MPTYTWTRTRDQIRDKILRKLGVLSVGQTADNDDAAIVHEAMDMRLKELHGLGVLWWNVSGGQTNVTLTAGQATATITATDFLFPVSLMFANGNEQSPIEFITHSEYQAIPTKTEAGTPVKAYVTGSTVYLWPAPQSNGTAKLTYQAISADTENAVPDIPVEMMRAFVSVVTADLVDEFGLMETSPQSAQKLMLEQPEALKTIRTLNVQRVDNTTVTASYF